MDTSVTFDLNIVLVPLVFFFGFLTLLTGGLLVLRSFVRYRMEVRQSIAMDLEVVKVTKKKKDPNASQNSEQWKEEVLVMEKLFAAIASFKQKTSWWRNFFYQTPNVVFEIANPAGSEETAFYLAAPKYFREAMEKQVQIFFPEAVMEKVSDYTIFTPGGRVALSTLALKESHALPLKTYKTMGTDTLEEFTNAMSKLDTFNEGAAIQIVVTPVTGTSWRREGRDIARHMQQGKRLEEARPKTPAVKVGRVLGQGVRQVVLNQKHEEQKAQEEKPVSLTPEEQELVKAIETKTNQPPVWVNIRLLASAKTDERAEQILSYMENAFTQFEYPGVNTLRVERRSRGRHTAFDYIFRNFDAESALLLSAEEVASIFHFPISVTETPKIKWLKSGSAPPPVNILAEGVLLGYNEYRGTKTDIRITDNDRRRHLYTIGQTGVGKSNFLQELAKKDALSGKGFCFIDPHGDAVEDILTAIPKERAEDVIVFDPADVARPIGLNMLEYDPAHPEQKTFVINEMIGIFDQLYDLKQTGGPMFEQYMRNAMLLIMEDPASGSTLMEISKVLADEDFRRYKLSKCANPVVRDFWIKEAEKAGGEAALANMVPYITSKLTAFVANDLMRPIIAQQESSINFRRVMDEGKILLVNLSKGKIGEINARLLGMVIVGKILMAALSRVDQPQDARRDFSLYLDEFQNVTTTSIAQILSEARKYRLILILAHQFIGQLKEEISKAVFGNVGSLVAFRVGPEDAEFLEKQFAPVFTAQDLVNVDNYQCFVRLLMNNELTKPFSMKTYPPTAGKQEVANAMKELSRLRYGRDARIVNREIMERLRLAESAGKTPL